MDDEEDESQSNGGDLVGDLAQEIARRIVALPSNTTSSGVTEDEVIQIVNFFFPRQR